MWSDRDDKLEALLDCIMRKDTGDAPLLCPACGRKDVHYYFHKWKDISSKGGMWIWCSNCRRFAHGTVMVPEWWENCKEIG
jgi:hypothetical protein